MPIPNPHENDDKVDWIDFDPENDPGIKKVKTKKSFGINFSSDGAGFSDDGCAWIFAIGTLLFILLVFIAALGGQ
jgi:hypothetical protein